MKKWLFRGGCLGAGFIAGVVVNNMWEVNRWYGYGVKAIPLNRKVFGVDDLILIALGLAIVIFGYFKMPLLAWFGAGWVLAQLLDKVME